VTEGPVSALSSSRWKLLRKMLMRPEMKLKFVTEFNRYTQRHPGFSKLRLKSDKFL